MVLLEVPFKKGVFNTGSVYANIINLRVCVCAHVHRAGTGAGGTCGLKLWFHVLPGLVPQVACPHNVVW